LPQVLLIAVAGALGALLRYGVSVLMTNLIGPTVLPTFIVNLTGAFALGVLIGIGFDRSFLPLSARPVVAAGFLGAYTTFSTLMVESVGQVEDGDLLGFTANLAGSVVLGLVAAYGGLVLGRQL
jgi:CrcB protein